MFYQISKYNVDIMQYVTTNRLLYWRPRKYSGKGCQKIHLGDPSCPWAGSLIPTVFTAVFAQIYFDKMFF